MKYILLFTCLMAGTINCMEEIQGLFTAPNHSIVSFQGNKYKVKILKQQSEKNIMVKTRQFVQQDAWFIKTIFLQTQFTNPDDNTKTYSKIYIKPQKITTLGATALGASALGLIAGTAYYFLQDKEGE